MERTREALSLLKREPLSAAEPSSWARLVFESGLPLLVKKVRFCERVVRGALLHSSEALEEMLGTRDSDAACRGSIVVAGGATVRAADIGVEGM